MQGHFSPVTQSTEILSNSSALASSICEIRAQSFGFSLRKYVVRVRPDVRDHVIYANDGAYSLICKLEHKIRLIPKPKISRSPDLQA